MKKTLLFFLYVLFLCFGLRAQVDTTFNSKKEIIIKGKRFRVYNNWMNVGMGEGLNSRLPLMQSILDVNLHFHIRERYFQIGTFLSGDRFLSFNNYNAHFCYGKRWENEIRNIFVCAGPSYSWGFPYTRGVYNNGIYTAFGGYVEAQYIFKPAYDLGLGLSVFGDLNYMQAVYGIRAELFFSGAYRGEKKGVRGHPRE
jgi:hypothetical protein